METKLDLNELLAHAEGFEQEWQRRCFDDPMLFIRGLLIPSAHGPQVFAKCMADFQLKSFKRIVPSLKALRDGREPPRRRFWIERTKGASKDSDLACCLLWLLTFPTRPLYLQVGAADKDQAGIVRRRMEDILVYNPWLNEHVQIQSYRVKNMLSQSVQLDILAADIAGSHGETPDLLVVNELSHIRKWEFVENLLDNADKVPWGVVVIATNAGFKGTKAEKWRSNAQESEDWSASYWQKPAPWISTKDIADAKRRNTLSRFNRLWYGKWASGKGDALSEDDIDKCLSKHKGPLKKPEPGWVYIGAFDLGVNHDHSGFVIVGVNYEERRLRLAWMRGWEPRESNHTVDLIDVEETILRMSRHFNLQWVGYDPTEARLMAQQLQRKNVPVKEYSFSSARNLTDMATAFVQSMGVLEAYDDNEGRLRRDFGKLNIVEKVYGYKLEAVSDEYGHADVGTALAICLPKAIAMLSGGSVNNTDDLTCSDEDVQETDEEFNEWPDELRDICEQSAPKRKKRIPIIGHGYGQNTL